MSSHFTDEPHGGILGPLLCPKRRVSLLKSRPFRGVPRDVADVTTEQGKVLPQLGPRHPLSKGNTETQERAFIT